MSNQKDMELKEYKLYQPVKTWLIENDFEVFPEVQKSFSARMIDVVGKREDVLYLIELKMFATKTLLAQYCDSRLDSEFCFGAVGSQPKPETIEKFRAAGIGLLLVKDGSVEEILSPAKKMDIFEPSRDGLIRRLYKRPDDFVAGLPCLKGQGPAQDCERRVRQFRAENPKATWKQVFAGVPNHYSSPSSMQSAMGKTRDRVGA